MAALSEIFSDLFARQDGALARVDPRSKLFVAAALLLGVMVSPVPWIPLTVCAACVSATVWLGMPARLVLIRLLPPLGIAAVLLVLQGIFTGSSVLWRWGFLSISREGVATGLLLGSRVLGGMSVLLLLSAATPAHRIFLALRALGLSKDWVEIAMLMYRYIFVLLDLTADVTDAQRVRLGYSNVRRGIDSAGVVAGVVLLRAIDQAVRTNDAMRTRGYCGNIPLGSPGTFAWQDFWIIATTVLVSGGIFYLEAKIR